MHEVMLRVERSVAKNGTRSGRNLKVSLGQNIKNIVTVELNTLSHVKNPLMRKQIYLIRTANNSL